MISWVGVVVPAHNEQELLAGCLAALRTAVAAVDIPVDLLVVLDSCTDASAAAARPAATLTIEARNVGEARRAGFSDLLKRRPAGVTDTEAWLATTDADTTVPPDWLAGMLAHAAAGWHAVAGTVRVTDWSGHTEQVSAAWHAGYEGRDHHPHVHGANLGVRADAYHAAGGMPAVALAEDVELIAALEAAGRCVFRAGNLPVTTSARRQGRADGGFASFLRELPASRSLSLPPAAAPPAAG